MCCCYLLSIIQLNYHPHFFCGNNLTNPSLITVSVKTPKQSTNRGVTKVQIKPNIKASIRLTTNIINLQCQNLVSQFEHLPATSNKSVYKFLTKTQSILYLAPCSTNPLQNLLLMYDTPVSATRYCINPIKT